MYINISNYVMLWDFIIDDDRINRRKEVDIMTDREVLDLVLEKLSGVEGKVSGVEGKVSGIEGKVSGIEGKLSGIEGRLSSLEADVTEIKGQMVELRDNDKMILSEVERVHEILDMHKEDKTVHIA